MFPLPPGSDPRGLTRGSTDGRISRWPHHRPTPMHPTTSPRLSGRGSPSPAPLPPVPRAGEMAHMKRTTKPPVNRMGLKHFATNKQTNKKIPFSSGKLLTRGLPFLPAAQPSTAAGAFCNLLPDFHIRSAISDFTDVPPATKSRLLIPGVYRQQEARSIPATGNPYPRSATENRSS